MFPYELNYGSVCAGLEAATQAWHPLGWKAAWYSEIEPFPCKVLAEKYPTTPNLGDMLKLLENDTFRNSRIDLLVGGTPCQSFSIAGIRQGLADDRGNLALEYCRLLNAKRPRWFVWENVPGVLSSSGGADFAAILSGWTGKDIPAQKFEKSGIIEGDFYSVAWRVLDAQYFGVPQRRRRVFVVGYLGKDWRPPVAVLFERESLRRDFTPSREKGQGLTGPLTRNSFTGSGTDGSDGRQHFLTFDTTQITSPQNGNNPQLGDPCHPLAAGAHAPAIAVFDWNKSATQDMRVDEHTTATLRAARCAEPAVAFALRGRETGAVPEVNGLGDSVGSLRSANGGSSRDYIASTGFTLHGSDGTTSTISETETASSLRTRPPGTIENSTTTIAVTGAVIRRLTPKECERLQGFPDDYTLVAGASDSARYKALGNSMAVPVMRWIGERITAVDHAIFDSIL